MEEVDGVPLVGSCAAALVVGVWPCVAVPVGVVDGVPPVGCSVTASVGVGLPVGSTILLLLVVLGTVKMCEVRTYCTYT